MSTQQTYAPSPELRRGIAMHERRVAAYIASLGGIGARVTVECGRQRATITGTLAAGSLPSDWPRVVTDDGRRWEAMPEEYRIAAEAWQAIRVLRIEPDGREVCDRSDWDAASAASHAADSAWNLRASEREGSAS